jgi:hypothetical protein
LTQSTLVCALCFNAFNQALKKPRLGGVFYLIDY